MKKYDSISDILGFPYVTTDSDSALEYISLASEGMKAYTITNFRDHYDLSVTQIAAILGTSEPTLYRKIKSNALLNISDAVKLLEVTDLFLYGEDVLESRDNFFMWLDLPNTALGGLTPMEVITYPEGISKVRDLLSRIEYGVYS
ncbi:antitoxin Xre/MbcA/ParS toxin-binding domain-containing protein [Belliella pelovolcani]|uniref:Putative toxin-antitoxin system antitoxin component, TIGR02293 family n=1 Tax=Belliella pelovolcani TaxID=529505 RepID=A0A1N7LQS6_9BACT|nr:antitoxin Xre/MbcA/ParS toxin-binding domain-containing protein [Belliella pelovolcani]SIS76061.1 putative toxin-antitoxin system antitoxin component, TIGR02293 family [Belliella pelovolcani]